MNQRTPNTGFRPEAAAVSVRRNSILLLLNLGVLMANLVLSLATTSAQARPTDGGTGRIRVAPRSGASGTAMPCSRVLQVLDSIAQDSIFTAEQLSAVHDAIRRYQATIEIGIDNLVGAERGCDLRTACADLDKDARAEVEMALSREFSDPALVQRLATEVIRSCR